MGRYCGECGAPPSSYRADCSSSSFGNDPIVALSVLGAHGYCDHGWPGRGNCIDVAGIAGAIVTTLAMCGPTAVLAHFLGKVWDRFRDAPWRVAVQAGVVPISVGLVGASAIVLTRAADHSWVAAAITLGTAALAYRTRWNPLWLIGVAGLAGFTGLV